MRRAKVKVKVKPKKPAITQEQMIAELLEHAQIYLDNLDIHNAARCFYKILDLDPNNHLVMDDLAELLIQMGEDAIAKQVLERSIQLAPDSGYSKYMNLAQLLVAEEAIKCYKFGLERMMAQERTPELDQAISSCFCSMVELYLTDLCDQPDAEQQCERLIEMALKYTPHGPEPHQVLASVRISQQRNQDALALLLRSVELWRPTRARDEEGTAIVPEAQAQVPSYDFRETTCQLLLELGQFPLAAELLEDLLEEDDEVIEVVYMAALANSHVDVNLAKTYLQDAINLMNKPEMKVDPADPIRQQLAELAAKLAQVPDEAPAADDNDDDEDNMD